MTLSGRRVLVTGATGLLGQAVVLEARRAGAQVLAGVHRRRLSVPGVRCVPLDLGDIDSVRASVHREKPALVVHTAALVAPDACEADPELAFRLNVTAARVLAEACAETGAMMVHISSDSVYGDAVYGDAPPPFTERSVVRAGSVYARSKLLSEQAVLDALADALVLRTNFFGWSGAGSRSLAEFFHTALTEGTPVSGFTDVQFTPLYQRDLSELLLLAADKGIAGVRNLGSSTTLSKFAFGRTIAEVFGLDPQLVRPASRNDAGLRAVRSANLAMDSSRIATELDVRLPTTREGIERLFLDFEAGLPEQLRAQLRELGDEGITRELQDR